MFWLRENVVAPQGFPPLAPDSVPLVRSAEGFELPVKGGEGDPAAEFLSDTPFGVVKRERPMEPLVTPLPRPSSSCVLL